MMNLKGIFKCLTNILRLAIIFQLLFAPLGYADPEKPNIVIMLADDLGWADVGYHGSDIKTPSIDRLSKEGMRLERFYVNPICTPTRASLLTGRDALAMGVGYFPILAWSNKAVPQNEIFMSEILKQSGYQTGMVGKWHLGHTLESHTPNANGFDDFFGHLHTQVFYYSHQTSGGHDLQHNGKSVKRAKKYLTNVHAEEAVRFITDRDKEKPFFLYVPFLAPHSPMEAPKDLIKKYRNRPLIGMPRENPLHNTFPANHLKRTQQVYAAMVDSMDQAIGRILDALDVEGIANNTIVLFLSDNGGFYGFGADNRPLRGEKMTVFEGGIRVPAVIRWSEKISKASINHQVLSVMDLLPTLADATEIDLSSRPIEGLNAWPLKKESSFRSRDKDLFFVAEQPTASPLYYAVIRGEWKLIQIIKEDLYSKSTENMLFNINEDPNEKVNLAEKFPDKVQSLAIAIKKWAASHPVAGQRVEIAPNPGWLPPKDWAEAIIPDSKVQSSSSAGFPAGTVQRLEKAYSGRGTVIYN